MQVFFPDGLLDIILKLSLGFGAQIPGHHLSLPRTQSGTFSTFAQRVELEKLHRRELALYNSSAIRKELFLKKKKF